MSMSNELTKLVKTKLTGYKFQKNKATYEFIILSLSDYYLSYPKYVIVL